MDIAETVDRARRLEHEGKWREALDLLKDAARENPCEDVEIEIASLLTVQGWRAGADRWLAEYCVPGASVGIEFEPSDAEAQEFFTESLSWFDGADARSGLAGVHVRRGEVEKAEGHLRAALEIAPGFPPALVLLGRLMLARKDVQGAGEAFATAVQEAPTYAAAYVGLGEAHWRVGRKDAAAACFSAGLTHCPGSGPIHATYAALLLEEGAHDGVLHVWRKAVEANVNNVEAWRGVALESARAGDALETSRALDEAVRIDPEGTAAWVESQKKAFPLLGGTDSA